MASGNSGDAGKKGCCAFPAVNKSTLVSHYAPMIGGGCYSLLSINVLNPSVNFGLLAKRDTTNILMAGALIGAGAYIYSRPHIQAAPKEKRLLYAGYGSIAFTFSSILLWAIIRGSIADNVAVGSAVGLASCYVITKTATGYLKFVDEKK